MPAPPAEPLPTNALEALRMTLDMPWKAVNQLRLLLLLPWARWTVARSGIAWQPGWRLYGMPIIQKHRRSTLRIGRDMHLRSSVRSNPLGPNHPCILSTRRAGASLIIGDGFQMTGGSIVCEDTIRIGNRVMVGCNTVIADTDFHPLDSAQRQGSPLDGATAPVFIEDDVFIGMNSLVLKGVRLGKGCVIGAGSVVTQDVPPGAVAAGSPARVIREAR